jgi:hypothetical protein
MRRNGKYLLVVGAGAVALSVSAAPGSAGPVAAKGWENPVLVSATRAARETSLVINPRNEKELFLCDPSGVPALFDKQSYFYRSVDGGKKWSYVDVETTATDTREYSFEGGDCDVAYDAGGTMWTADTWVGNLSIGHSKNGESWEGTAVSTSAPVVDRPWIVGGPPGTLYVAFHDLQCCVPSAMWFTKTTDYGKTFSPAVPITTVAPGGAYTWEGNFEVAPGGKDIYLVYSRRVGGAVQANLPVEITLASSHDGGLTWTSKVITTIEHETSSIYPSIGRDAGGYLHVVWAMERDDDAPVFYAMSKDGGAQWSKPRALNPGKSGFAPWVAGGKKGQARIAWLGSPQAQAPTDWYFYYAKVDGSRTTVGTTTRKPVWVGAQTVPEFEMVRLDKKGRMHLGMSVFTKANTWAVYYQREKL